MPAPSTWVSRRKQLQLGSADAGSGNLLLAQPSGFARRPCVLLELGVRD